MDIAAIAMNIGIAEPEAREFIALHLSSEIYAHVLALNKEMAVLAPLVQNYSPRHFGPLYESFRSTYTALHALSDHIAFITAYPSEWPSAN